MRQCAKCGTQNASSATSARTAASTCAGIRPASCPPCRHRRRRPPPPARRRRRRAQPRRRRRRPAAGPAAAVPQQPPQQYIPQAAAAAGGSAGGRGAGGDHAAGGRARRRWGRRRWRWSRAARVQLVALGAQPERHRGQLRPASGGAAARQWWTHLAADGLPGALRLGRPGYEQEVTIELKPPRAPEAEARPWQFQLVAKSKAQGGARVGAGPGTLVIGPFTDFHDRHPAAEGRGAAQGHVHGHGQEQGQRPGRRRT